MSQYPVAIDLQFLAPPFGLTFRSGQSADWFGLSVASAGDVNGDGITDYLIGAPAWHVRENRPNPPVAGGTTYLVFGGTSLATLDAADGTVDGIHNLSLMTAAEGYRLKYIPNTGDATGASVAGIGEFDGKAGGDILIGSPGLTGRGAVTLVSGGTSLVSLDGADGTTDGTIDLNNAWISMVDYVFVGRATGDRFGIDVNGSADINGDGLVDLLLGSHMADQTGATNGGEAALVFGGAASLAAVDGADGVVDHFVSIENLDGTTGYLLQGNVANNYAGFRVEGIADVGGDGVADILVGAYQLTGLGETYLLFGGAGNLAALDVAGGAAADGRINITTVNGSNGYRLISADDGDQFGLTLSSAGDVNGDGVGDIIVGDPFSDPNGNGGQNNNGDAYLIFGGAQSLSTLDAADGAVDGTLDMDFLNGVTGYRISGAGSEWIGQAVDAAGDVDGDGFGDLLIGANFRAPSRQGAVYVFFGGGQLAVADAADGTTDGRIVTTAFASYAPTAAFRIDGVDAGDQAGFSVASLGDVDGDLMADIMIGSVRDQSGIANSGDGEAYIVYSRPVDTAVTRTGSVIGQTIIGGGLNDVLSGLAGDDVLLSYGGNDQLLGGADDDVLQGGSGNDQLDGGDGADLLYGGVGNDTIVGGLGRDTLIYSGAGATTGVVVNINRTTAQNTVGAGIDTISGVEDVTGTTFADTLTGNTLNNLLIGREGNDVLDGFSGDDVMLAGDGNDGMRGSAGADHYDGGNGVDVVNFAASGGVNVFLDGSGTNGASAVGDTFINVENLIGGIGPDFLVGNGSDNRFTGNNGDDRLWGRGGIDQLEGGAGSDRLWGGPGNDILVGGLAGGTESDTFVFGDSVAAGGFDRTADFTAGTDKIEIDASMFGGGLVAGGPVQFVSSSTPSSAGFTGGVFLYDTDTGFLAWDADGGGSGGAVNFFRLQNLPALSAGDFIVVA